jgi:predicted amidohydrolase YtcJ
MPQTSGRRRARWLCAAALLPLALEAQPRAAGAADLVLRRGRIFTADGANPWAESVAIVGERLVFVGADSAVQRHIGVGTREIDLAGRVVIPGINDAHDHLGGDAPPGASFRTSVSPTPDDAFRVVQDSVRAIVARTPPGTWVSAFIGIGVLNDAFARRAALDRIAPQHPVVLSAWWGHGVLLNSAAMRRLELDETAPDRIGGWAERTVDGRTTGRLDEYAGWEALRRVYSRMPEDDVVAGLRAVSNDGLRLGVTSVQNMAGYLTPAVTISIFRRADLAQRVRLVRWPMADATGRNTIEWDTVGTRVAPRVVVSGRKWVLDATPIDQFALNRRAYPDRPAWYGRLNFAMDTVRAMLADALRPDAAQLHLHVVGDSAALLVLDAMRAMAPDSVWRTKRVRLEHGNGIVGAAVRRARELGIVIAQPRQNSAPLRTWFAAGIPVAYGSDGLRNPFVHLFAAVAPTRDSAESITREQAVLMLTRHAAFAEFTEQENGALMVGMLADLAVLSQDVFTVPTRALPGTTSVLTVIGGRVVHDARPSP